MMLLAIFALFVLSSVPLEATKEIKENIYEENGHRYHHGQRLGKLSEAPFIELYRTYAHYFVIPDIDPVPEPDDLRRYRPSGSFCQGFFANLDYKVDDFDKLVALDACLGYVMDGVYKEEVAEGTAQLSQDAIDNFDELRKSPDIIRLYSTRINEPDVFTAKERTCVADLLTRAIKAKAESPGVICNTDMIQIYIQFAECQAQQNFKHLKHENVEDSYVELIYSLLRKRAAVCFKQEVAHIENAVIFDFHRTTSVADKVIVRLPFANKRRKQAYKYGWPEEISELLAIVQHAKNPDKQVNLREVHKIISFVRLNDKEMEKRFLDNLSEYATKKLEPHRRNAKDVSRKDAPERGDADGLHRYEEEMDRLCNPFRVSSDNNRFSYALSIIRLVELIQYPEVFHITEDDFLASMVKWSYETSPVYLAAQSCNLITFTQGTYVNTGRGVRQYKVSMKPNTKNMITWPLMKFN